MSQSPPNQSKRSRHQPFSNEVTGTKTSHGTSLRPRKGRVLTLSCSLKKEKPSKNNVNKTFSCLSQAENQIKGKEKRQGVNLKKHPLKTLSKKWLFGAFLTAERRKNREEEREWLFGVWVEEGLASVVARVRRIESSPSGLLVQQLGGKIKLGRLIGRK